MCLRTEQIEPQIATEDIICYKIIRKNMTSLYYNKFKWEFGKLYKTEMQFYNSEQIAQAFHSYKSYKDVREAYSRTTEPCVVVKCTIPKDTSYYTGNHGVCEGYASEKIIINEIIPLKELYPYFDFDNYPYKEGDKIIIEFVEDIPNVEAVIENIQPNPTNYRVNFVDMIVSSESKYMYISAKFDGKEFKIQRQVTHPITEQCVTIEEMKIKED